MFENLTRKKWEMKLLHC